MTREEIMQMGRQAGFDWSGKELTWEDVICTEELESFAKLVAQHAKAEEREACAKLCEELRDDWFRGLGRYEFMGEGADNCADAIRARGQA